MTGVPLPILFRPIADGLNTVEPVRKITAIFITVDPRYQETRIRNFQAQLFGKFVQRSACLSQNIQQN